ncbi:hypothetical protein [Achromobacter pestifer]
MAILASTHVYLFHDDAERIAVEGGRRSVLDGIQTHDSKRSDGIHFID